MSNSKALKFVLFVNIYRKYFVIFLNIIKMSLVAMNKGPNIGISLKKPNL